MKLLTKKKEKKISSIKECYLIVWNVKQNTENINPRVSKLVMVLSRLILKDWYYTSKLYVTAKI